MSDTAPAYFARLSVLEEPRTYRLTADALLIDLDDGTPPGVVRFADITRVTLRYFPTRFQWNRFECLISSRTRGELRLASEFYRGVADFEDRSAAYGAFVAALCPRVRAVNPVARFITGRPRWVMVLELGFLLAMCALLIAVLILVGDESDGWVWLRVLFVVPFFPLCWGYAQRNRPGTFDPHAIPTDLLPAE